MTQAAPPVCQLAHAGFRMLGEPVFRLSEGSKIPSMVVELESQRAVLPLRSVVREFKIEPESPDGQMLALIEQALDFVVCVRLGDTLPPELNGGEASWEPSEQDRKTAASRIRQHLVRCIFARMGKTVAIKSAGTPGWEEEPSNRSLLQEAIAGAATLIGDVEIAEVFARVATLNEEMAFIECMRRTLSRGMNAMREKLLRIDVTQLPSSRQDTLKQVQILARKGLAEITSRFDVIDARLDDLLALLREMQAAVGWLRHQRDWLVRTNYAWSPVFNDWVNAPNHIDEFLWKVVERTYPFLAPRFMSFQEWTVNNVKPKKDVLQAVVW